LGILEEKEAMPVELTADDKPLDSGFTISGYEISLSIASKLSIGGLFEGSFSDDERAFVFDAAAVTDKYRDSSLEPGTLAMTRWGVGYRIAIRASDIKAGLKLGYATVAAAVDLGMATARYEIKGIGIGMGLDVMTEVLAKVNLSGQLNGDNFFTLTNDVSKTIAQYLQNHKATLGAAPMAAGIGPDLDSQRIETARSVFLAMQSISRGESLKSLLDRAQPTWDQSLIRSVYSTTAEQIPETQRPGPQAVTTAKAWLATS
jgi:hypothetical protein